MNKTIVLGLLFCPFVSFAQDIEVKKFEPMEKDQTAVTSPRKDINGNDCGLVKVALKEAGAEFEGNVMGDVMFTGSEYLVYLPNGTKRLGIKHPDYLPTTIVFADYGTKRVVSGTTYQLNVKTNKKKAKIDNSKKGMAVFNIKPSNAMLMIDGQIADGSGGVYTLSLPYGTHYYTVKLKDFSVNNQMFLVSRDVQTINTDLTTFFAFVNISSASNDASIYVNNEFKSNGCWEGFLPPSSYNIELRKEGYLPLSKTIELYESDSLSFTFPKMKIIGGKLKVNYKPDDSSVYVDGNYIGKTPLEYDEVSNGRHRVEIRCENYESSTHEIDVIIDQSQLLEGKLQLTDLGYLLTKANEGDIECQWRLGNIYLGKDRGLFERKDLQVDSHRQCPHLERNLDKAIYWLEKAAAGTYDFRKSSSDYPRWAKESLSECNILKKDFNKSFYWAEMSKDKLLLAIHYYFGLGIPKDKQKCARQLLGMEWYIKRLDLNENGIRRCEAGNQDDMTLREAIYKIVEFNGKKEIWNIALETE